MARTGKAKWMGDVSKEDLREGTALLQISSNTKRGVVTSLYWVFVKGTLARLKKWGRGSEVYSISGEKCSCPDAGKGNVCKHVKALAAALPHVKG